ncbi:PLDc N-terminal domain-containing protein [Microbacterium sp. H37-C3]|uniref:PLDc N-terminal domain-containing protein n=1 Tax=Microbacterium sp. H37-C3 TaxID=3004354 RepID=UPI0022AF5699|nr:PLDc N-terminal domain-containing protein [Microbacterium sp. H37-C3]MCZ4067909.1 PLDc N-terminal domain-containing protein [Microbacterium sp. H37-C3]
MIETARFLVISDEWLPREWMPGVATSVVVVLAVIAALAAILFISSLISILASPRYTGGGKLLWIIGIFVFPIAGPLVWWLGGRKARIRTDRV